MYTINSEMWAVETCVMVLTNHSQLVLDLQSTDCVYKRYCICSLDIYTKEGMQPMQDAYSCQTVSGIQWLYSMFAARVRMYRTGWVGQGIKLYSSFRSLFPAVFLSSPYFSPPPPPHTHTYFHLSLSPSLNLQSSLVN